MKPARTLVLKQERLVELTSGDLAGVVAGDAAPTLPVNRCLSIQVCYYTEGVRCLTSAACPTTIC